MADVRIIRAILKSAESNKPVTIEPVQIARRPEPEQEIFKQAVSPPKLVRAAAPGRD